MTETTAYAISPQTIAADPRFAQRDGSLIDELVARYGREDALVAYVAACLYVDQAR